jgi:hypothetical protein
LTNRLVGYGDQNNKEGMSMTDLENVIHALKTLATFKKISSCKTCAQTAEFALVLLKRQEPIDPIIDKKRNRLCPNCCAVLKGRFCHECGQAVLWDKVT